jgi:hypothetical protein
MSSPSLIDRQGTPRKTRGAVARQVLSMCAGIDAITAEAHASLGLDEDRLFALLETREQMLLELAESVAVLQHSRPAADNALFAATERAVDDADALIATVCDALQSSERATKALAARVAERVEQLREELAAVQRATSVSSAYQLGGHSRHVDLRR